MLLTCVLVLCFASAVHYVQGQAAFAILVYPDQLILGTRSGLTDRFDVSVAAGERFNGTVSLSASGVPSGVSASFKETSSYLTPLTIFATYLEITSSPGAKEGNYTVTISATSQQLSNFTAASDQVNLIIRENGQPLTTVDHQPATTPTDDIAILALVAGLALGSCGTYMMTRRTRRRTRRARK